MSESNGFASKADLLGRAKRRYTTVDVFGLKFRIQSLTEGERSRLEASALNEATGRPYRDGIERTRRLGIALALVDGNGNRLYSEEQAEELADVDSAYTERLWEAINQHCDLKLATAEEIGELAKN